MEKVDALYKKEIQDRGNYAKYISKPTEARESCSRLSPYIAWGNVSIREIYQKAKQVKAIDTTAAGDTFIGYFLAGLANEFHFEAALELATQAAAKTVTRKGGAISIPFMEALL